MSEGEAPLIGVVGDDSDDSEAFERVETVVVDAGGRLVAGGPGEVIDADPTTVIAVGEQAFVAVATTIPDAPVLPVGAGRGLRSVPETDDDVAPAIRRVVDEDWTTESHPVLGVDVDGEHRGRAVMDATVATAEAAHISEYRVAVSETVLGQVRADGIVVATPVGSPGYARRIGAPVVGPGAGVVVVPIAPFTTDPDHWVVDLDGVTIEQLRSEADVELILDDAVDGLIDPSETVTCRVDGDVSTIVVPESRSRYR